MKVVKVDFGGECAGKFESWTKDFFFAPWMVGSASIATQYESWVAVHGRGEYRELRLDLIGWRAVRRNEITGLPVVPMRVWTRFYMS